MKRKAMNFPLQGSCADSLKLALALLYERRHECPSAILILSLHDEIVVECDEGDVEAVAAWLEQAMKDGMAEVLALGTSDGAQIPVEVEVKSGKTWGGELPSSPLASGADEEEELPMSAHCDDGPVLVRSYIDYRDPSADVYPHIDVCGECAEEFDADLGEQGNIPPGEATRCEICGA